MQTEQRSFASERSDVRPLWVSDRPGKTPPPLGARSTVQSDLHVLILSISLMTRPSSDCGSRAESTRLVLEGGRVAAARDQHGLKRSKVRYLAVLRGMPLFGPAYEKGNRANFAFSRKPTPAYIDAVRLATMQVDHDVRRDALVYIEPTHAEDFCILSHTSRPLSLFRILPSCTVGNRRIGRLRDMEFV